MVGIECASSHACGRLPMAGTSGRRIGWSVRSVASVRACSSRTTVALAPARVRRPARHGPVPYVAIQRFPDAQGVRSVPVVAVETSTRPIQHARARTPRRRELGTAPRPDWPIPPPDDEIGPPCRVGSGAGGVATRGAAHRVRQPIAAGAQVHRCTLPAASCGRGRAVSP